MVNIMNELLNTSATMTSLQISDIIGKRHSDVMRDIRDESEKLAAGGFDNERKFALVDYIDSKGESRPCYRLTREGVLQLAARYDAVTRAKLIEMAMRAEQPRQQMSHVQLLASIASEMANQERTLASQQAQLDEVSEQVQDIRETVVYVPEHWRDDINAMVNKMCLRQGRDAYQSIRRESYELLSSRARCDLKRLLTNHQKRMRDAGSSKSAADKQTYMDVIEQNPRLREIYTAIVKELSTKYWAPAGAGPVREVRYEY